MGDRRNPRTIHKSGLKRLMIKIKRLATNINISTNQFLVIPPWKILPTIMFIFHNFPNIFSQHRKENSYISASIFIASQFEKKISIKNVGHVLKVIYYRNEKFCFLSSHSQTSESLFANIYADERNIFSNTNIENFMLSSLFFC